MTNLRNEMKAAPYFHIFKNQWHLTLLVFLFPLILLISTNTWAVACSPYAGKATINEFHKDDPNNGNSPTDFTEVKILDSSIDLTTFGDWEIRICEKYANSASNSSDGCNTDTTGTYQEILLSEFTRQTKPWLVLEGSVAGKWLNMKSGFDAILLDKNKEVIDYFSGQGYQPQIPTSGCIPSTTSSSKLPFDNFASWPGNSTKTIRRIEDGTGDWEGAPSAVDPGSIDTTNDVLPSGTTELPLIIIDDVSKSPGNTFTFTVSIYGYYDIASETIDTGRATNESIDPIVISYKTLDGTATSSGDLTDPSNDYVQETSGSITISGGGTSATISVDTSSISTITFGDYFFIQLTGITSSATAPAAIYDTFGTATFIAPSGPDHYELSMPSSTVSCLSPTVTVTACSDNSSPCTNPATTLSGATATLSTSPSPDSSLGTTNISFNALGVATTTLSYPAAIDGATATVTLSGESTAAINSRQCCLDGSSCSVANSCNTTFNTAGLIFSTTATGNALAYPPVQANTAGVDSVNYYLRAIKTSTTTKACEALLTGSQTVDMSYSCADPAVCSAGNLMTISGTAFTGSSGAPTLTFDPDGAAPFTFNFMDVGRIGLSASKSGVGGTTITGSSASSFVIKPYSLVLTDIEQTAAPQLANPAAVDASGSKFITAGEAFSATVAAVNASCAASLGTYTLLTDIPASCITPNYGKESTPEGVTLTNALVTGLGLTNNPVLSNPTAFGSFSGGTATGSTFSWDEVGIIKLTPAIGDNDYLGGGTVTGVESANVGRFFPANFAVTVANSGSFTNTHTPALPLTSFTYLGESFGYTANPSLTITAVNSGGGTVANYTGAFNFLTVAEINLTYPTTDNAQLGTDANPLAVASAVGVPSLTDNGDGTLTMTLGGDTADSFSYDRNLGMVAPFTADLTIALTGINETNDTVSSNAVNVSPTGNLQRFGRATLNDVYGANQSIISMPFNTEFFDGVNWLANIDDLTTSITVSTDMSCTPNGFTCSVVAPPANLHVTGINITPGGSFTLTPQIAITGDALLRLTTPNWLTFDWNNDGDLTDLEDFPSAIATFGIYRGDDRFYYWREER